MEPQAHGATIGNGKLACHRNATSSGLDALKCRKGGQSAKLIKNVTKRLPQLCDHASAQRFL
jgi:hypothetical protein